MADIFDTLHPKSNPSDNLYPNIRKKNIPNKSIDVEKLSDNVMSLIGSLKPSGVDTSTNILAFSQNKGIWVGSDDGNWYYWDGAQYVVGGQFIQALNVNDITNFIANYTIALNGQTTTLTPVYSTAWRYQIIDCVDGDLFTITAAGGDTSRLWAFIDSNNTILACSQKTITVTNLLLEAPTNAVKLIVNDSSGSGKILKGDYTDGNNTSIIYKPNFVLGAIGLYGGDYSFSNTRYASGYIYIPSNTNKVRVIVPSGLLVGLTGYKFKNGDYQYYTYIDWKSTNFDYTPVDKSDGITLCVKTSDESLPDSTLLSKIRVIYTQNYNYDNDGVSLANTTLNGDCLIINTNNSIVMTDTGEGTSGSRLSIIKSMREYDSNHVDYLIISHFHSDHVDDIQWLIDMGYVDISTNVYLPSGFNSVVMNDIDPAVVTSYNDFMTKINTLGCTKVYPSDYDELIIGDAHYMFFNCDHTSMYTDMANNVIPQDYNQCSMAFRFEYGLISVVSTGDGVGYFWEKYWNVMKKCTIFKGNHHAVDSVCPEILSDTYPLKFMSGILPEIIITSLGSTIANADSSSIYYDRFTNNLLGLQQWCENNHIPNYVTGYLDQGGIRIKIDKNSYKFLSNHIRCIRGE